MFGGYLGGASGAGAQPVGASADDVCSGSGTGGPMLRPDLDPGEPAPGTQPVGAGALSPPASLLKRGSSLAGSAGVLFWAVAGAGRLASAPVWLRIRPQPARAVKQLVSSSTKGAVRTAWPSLPKMGA